MQIRIFHRRTFYSKSRAASPHFTGSAKLFADAERYDNEETPHKSAVILEQDENWTGDEKIQDTVLRMLVDKYKPLRTCSIQSADQKIKNALPRMTTLPVNLDRGDQTDLSLNAGSLLPSLKPSTGSWATEPLLPSNPGHQPWHTTFQVPSHSIKYAHIPGPSVPSKNPSTDPIDGHSRIQNKKAQHVGRLTRARESTLDYRMGIRKSGQGISNPLTLKGWTNLVEEKIEKARQAGLFKNVKGHGRPLAQSIEEQNPFIAREEFLLNRIVQRNGAAPPWVVVQRELEAAVETFRRLLRQTWIRRTLRILTLTHTHPTFLSRLTLGDIKAHRDPEWVLREKSYHDAAIKELNDLVRKYNATAPYSVRRNYYVREVEVEKLYVDCAEEILAGIGTKTDGGFGGHLSLADTKDNTSDRMDVTFALFDEGLGFSQLLQWWRVVLRRWQSFW